MEFATATWSEWWNTTRQHSTLGHVPPAEFEAAHCAAITASRAGLGAGRATIADTLVSGGSMTA
jgi:hypothetical protein